MRPQYQKYHEVRAELERLKVEITQLLGHFPPELEENRIASPSPGAWSDSSAAPSTYSAGLYCNLDVLNL